MFANGLVIQKQVSQDACIAASACSLIDALGNNPAPTQQQLHPLIVAGMKQNMSGFDSLTNALRQLKSPFGATRYTPNANSLVAWLQQQAQAHQGVLVSSHVQVGNQTHAHITVVFHDTKGNWFQADPGTATTTGLQLIQLVGNHAGDVAVIA